MFELELIFGVEKYADTNVFEPREARIIWFIFGSKLSFKVD